MTLPNLHPSILNTRAVITTRWGGTAYRPITMNNIESYYVDTALDNDADTWTLSLGDPNGDLIDLLERNNEIRVQLFGVGQEGINFLMTGLADDAEWEDGSWTLTGRDLSSLATDSTVRPLRFRQARAWAIVEEQAQFLGFKNMSLAKGTMVKKLEQTDGSESYWEFWYRMYRREKMWIWCEPNGLLVAGNLNYDQPPTYYIGDPRDDDTAAVVAQCIPVVQSTLRKTTQTRLYDVKVYGHKGDTGFNTEAFDTTIANWQKKPIKVMLDTDSHTIKGAQKMAWEEIFEGKVGALEFRITIPDPGFTVRQNRVARVNLPDVGLFGTFFVVGSRVQAGPDGFVQEIRLREKQYAISRRVPDDPKLVQSKIGNAAGVSSLGAALEATSGDIPVGWGDFFVKAARQFQGVMDYNLFLATLMAIADQETHFQNERELGGPGGNHIWYPYQAQSSGAFPPPGQDLPGTIPSPGAPGQKQIPTGETRESYEQKFANEKGGKFNLSKDYGVGPMQLTSVGIKHEADDKFKANFQDEYAGGRWDIESNIWAGASDLHQCVLGMGAERDIDMWGAADAYNRGVAGAKQYFQDNGRISPYGQSIKVKVLVDPGYLQVVKSSVATVQAAAKAARDGESSFTGSSSTPAKDTTDAQILAFFNSYNIRSASPDDRRNAIVLAALYGWHHQAEIHYSDLGAFRSPVKTIGQPPNIPDTTDCSGFVTWLYYISGAVDPNGISYAGNGFTGTLWDTGQHISIAQLKLGDLVFYGNPASTHSHVCVYIGSNQVISHGTESDPSVQPIRYRADLSGFATYPL